MAQRCIGKTQKGEQCKNATTSESRLCYRHAPKKKADVVEVPVWEEKKYPVPDSTVETSVFKKITTLEKRGPKKSDEPGYIYIFFLSHDTESFFKIGRTKRTVKKRISEWKSKHGDGVKLYESFRVSCNQFCEHLIHLYLDPWRVYRYKIKHKQFCTVWKKDGEPVTADDVKLKKEHRLLGISKDVEWFYFEKKEDYMLDIVQSVCKKFRHVDVK